ncbi:MAG: lipid A core--O-antigen ligase [Deltaproteobacteria bacterium]|nr:lipid A core--O-antigen ligase [Deltaproteobacteria bacterium]
MRAGIHDALAGGSRLVAPSRWRLRLTPVVGLQILLPVITVGSLLAIGAVHPPVMLVLGATGILALCLALAARLGPRRASPVTSPVAVLLALAGFCFLQQVPLPLGWLEVLGPANADVWSRALLPLGESVAGPVPLSLDPGATRMEVLRWLTYGGAFAAASVVASRRGAPWGVGLVFMAALVAALATIGHGLVGATKVFGLYEPSFVPAPWHVGPLLNPNNLSGYLNLGAMCGLGLLLTREPVAPHWLVGVCVAVLVGVNVTTGSRGGVALLPVGVLVLAVIVTLSRRRRGHSSSSVRRARLVMVLAVAFGVVLALLGGTSGTWKEIFDENLDKLGMLLWVRPLVSEFRWLGVGRGAFESVFPAFQQGTGTGAGSIVYTHAENFPAQWLAEWGVPVTAVALVALCWLFRPGRLGVGRSAVAAGAWLGVLLVLVQNMVDLGLEIPGLCVGVAVVLGSLWGDQSRVLTPKGASLRSARVARWIGVAALAGALAVAAAARTGLDDLGADRARVKQSLLEQPRPRSALERRRIRAALRAAMQRHPAEPYFPLMGALLAWQEHDQSPMPWLQRALERSLRNGKAHLLLAQVLHEHGAKRQALMELRLAVQNDSGLVGPAAALGVAWTRETEGLLLTVPEGERAVDSLDALGLQLTAVGDRRLGAAFDRWTIERDSLRPGPHGRLAEDVILSAGQGGCAQRRRCEQAIEEHVAALRLARPELSLAAQLRARWLLAVGDPAGAVGLLVRECEQATDYASCLHVRALAAAKLEGPRELGDAAKELLTASCMQPEPCAAAASWIGELYAGRGEWAAAVTAFARAAQEEPTEARFIRLGDAASQAGLHGQAADAYARALRLHGSDDPALRARLEREKEHTMNQLLHQ